MKVTLHISCRGERLKEEFCWEGINFSKATVSLILVKKYVETTFLRLTFDSDCFVLKIKLLKSIRVLGVNPSLHFFLLLRIPY